MKHVNSIEIDYNKEELIPWFSPEFPYIASCAELGKYREREVPWHWHRMVELFYMKSGTIEYTTPAGKWIIPAGSGGMVNSNVLHASIVRNPRECGCFCFSMPPCGRFILQSPARLWFSPV